MIEVGTISDMKNRLFVDFCERNSCGDLTKEISQYWEYPWIFYNSRVFNAKKIQCIGKHKETMMKCLINEGVSEDYICNNYLNYNVCDKLDLVIGIGLNDECDDTEVTHSICSSYRKLKEGGKIIFTIKASTYNSSVQLGIIKEILEKSSFVLERNSEHLNLNDYIYKLSETHKNNILLEDDKSVIGIVLYKPYSITESLHKKFSFKKSWIDENNESRNCIKEFVGFRNHMEIYNDKLFRSIWIPEELISKEFFNAHDICSIFNVDYVVAMEIINELMLIGCLIEKN